MPKGFKNIYTRIKEQTLDKWLKGTKTLIDLNDQRFQEEEAQKKFFMQILVPKWAEANAKGVSTRKLAELTNGQVSHATIARYINDYRKRLKETEKIEKKRIST